MRVAQHIQQTRNRGIEGKCLVVPEDRCELLSQTGLKPIPCLCGRRCTIMGKPGCFKLQQECSSQQFALQCLSFHAAEQRHHQALAPCIIAFWSTIKGSEGRFSSPHLLFKTDSQSSTRTFQDWLLQSLRSFFRAQSEGFKFPSSRSQPSPSKGALPADEPHGTFLVSRLR